MLPRKRRANHRRGAGVVEFAFAAPVLFLFIFGIIEFGRVMMVKNTLTNGAREGCRAAALATTTDRNQIDAAVHRQIDNAVPFADVTVDVTPSSFDGSIPPGTPITVALSVNYGDVSWLPMGYLVGNMQLRAATTHNRE